MNLLILLLIFFCNPQDELLTIFVHIPKTAGETFKRNIEASLPRHQFIRTSFTHGEPYYDILQNKILFYQGFDHFNKTVRALSKPEAVRCLAGHDSYFGIHKLFKKKARYITFLRDPIERTLSLYNFEKMAYEIYAKKPSLNAFEKTFFERLKNHQRPDFETWLEEIYDQKHPFYFTMTHYLKHLGFDSLEPFDFVGLTESYEEDSLLLYHELGVYRFSADKNESIHFLTKYQLSPHVLEKLLEKNREDMTLYKLAVEKNQTFKRKREDYEKILSSMRQKKAFFLFFEPALSLFEKIENKMQKWKNHF